MYFRLKDIFSYTYIYVCVNLLTDIPGYHEALGCKISLWQPSSILFFMYILGYLIWEYILHATMLLMLLNIQI